MDYYLTEEQKMIRDLARDFAQNEIAPVAEHYDKSHEYPWPVIKKAQELEDQGQGDPAMWEEAAGGLMKLYERESEGKLHSAERLSDLLRTHDYPPLPHPKTRIINNDDRSAESVALEIAQNLSVHGNGFPL